MDAAMRESGLQNGDLTMNELGWDRCPHCGGSGTQTVAPNLGAQLLREFLNQHRLSVAQLARLTGIDDWNIKTWLTRGRPANPSAMVLEDRLRIPRTAWARVLGGKV
jgi:hypothetical protein